MLINKKSESKGFTKQEQQIFDNLVDAWNIYVKLEKQHPDDIHDFRKSLHSLQYLLGMRILRREHPELYSTYTDKDDYK